MIAGEWTGTMNLTEPHCGTDLGLIRTKAVKQADGSYKITGTKIFISAGEHDLADNIVHLVLARIEGAPEGTKGISLFVVPKFLLEAPTARPARATRVSCGSLEEKMGIHGNATCVMNYDGATGWLIGEENRGLHAMFTMMNEARLGVGMQGLAHVRGRLPERRRPTRRSACRAARSTGAKAKDKPADPIIVHPDVRRTLMTIKSFNEAARALVMWTALASDLAPPLRRREDAPGRRRSHGPADAGHQRRAHRHGLRQHRDGAADVRRPRLHRRARHGAVRARCPHHHDLRGRERHPGARPGRPQAAEGRRPRAAGVLRRGAGLHQGARRPTPR